MKRASSRPGGLADLDATAQAELVARGEMTAGELVAAACARIDDLDEQIGAVPTRLYEEAALAVAQLRPGARFGGVPFLMKDVGARQEGHPYYAGNRALREIDYRAEHDTPLGARFRELGLVTVGNSNSPEFGLQSNTWPLVHGPTRNPWDPARAAGGSSGGACAAVAAGLVPVAHATDGAGSIRIPAAWCGLIGLKPSRDRVAWRHAGKQRSDVEFLVARSLRDTAAFLDVLRPARARQAHPGVFSDALKQRPTRLRVGLCTRSPDSTPVHPACVAAVEAAVRVLGSLGHVTGESAPDALFEYEERALHGAVLGPQGYLECLEELAERLGRPVEPDDVEPFLWLLATEGTRLTRPGDIDRAVTWVRAWTARVLAWFETNDLLVTPTVHEPAPLLERLNPHLLDPHQLLKQMVPHMAFTEAWNATGQPAISLPLGWTDSGLPVGVQIVAAPEREDHLFGVAAQLLAALAEDGRRPAIHA